MPTTGNTSLVGRKIRVWDLPTRLFHWTLALSFAIAFATAESEHWRDIHVIAGYIVAGLIVFRLFWGFVGNRYARFAEFMPTARKLKAYISSVLAGRPAHFIGHNPLGAIAIFALLGLGLLSSLSGWMIYEGIGGDKVEQTLGEAHEFFANGMMVIVAVHLLGVVVSSWLHHENLVRAMITGCKDTTSGPVSSNENSAG